MAVRREVLGDAWVDRSLKNRNAFNTEFQEMITRIVWGRSGRAPASIAKHGAAWCSPA